MCLFWGVISKSRNKPRVKSYYHALVHFNMNCEILSSTKRAFSLLKRTFITGFYNILDIKADSERRNPWIFSPHNLNTVHAATECLKYLKWKDDVRCILSFIKSQQIFTELNYLNCTLSPTLITTNHTAQYGEVIESSLCFCLPLAECCLYMYLLRYENTGSKVTIIPCIPLNENA